MTTNDTNVQNLIINLLSQEQYENIDSPSSTELYLTPDTSLSEGDLKTINNTSIVGSGNITVQATISGAATTITNNDLTTNRALISNGSGKVAASSITSTKLGYLTDVTSNIQAQINNKQATISDLSTIRSGAAAGATAVQPSEISDMATQTWVGNQGYLTEHQDISGKANLSELASVATTGSYNDLEDKPTIPTVPTNVSDFTNDAGYITNSALSGYALTTDIPQSVSELDNDAGYLTEHQSLDGYQKTDTAVTHTKNTAVGNTITPVYINSSGAATALGYTIAKSVPSDANFSNTTYSAGTDLSLSGTTFNHKASGVTAGTVGTSTASSGSTLTVPYVTYNAQGHITATGTRTHTVSGFLTSHQDISGKANISELAEVATSGDYTDLINKPSIPSTYTDVGAASASHTHTYSEVGALSASTIIPVVSDTYSSTSSNGMSGKAVYNAVKDKADKSTSLSGYGITDAYTKTEIDGKLTGAMHYKGTVATVSALENISSPATGDMYNVESTGANYAYNGTSWDKLSENIDLSGYVSTSTTVNGKALTGNITLSASDVSALPSDTSIPVISDTYSSTSSNGMSGKAVASAISGKQNSDTAVTHTKNTAAGNTITPVYIASNGTATALNYTIAKSVPSDANFNDTTYTAGTGLSLSGTQFKHSNSVTAGTAGTNAATSGSTLSVPYVTYDAQGHVTASGVHTHTVSGFLTSHQDISGKADLSALAAVATSGDYTDLLNTPTIPTTYSDIGAASESHTHSGYQSTTTAVTHTASTAVGNTITPVYIASDGKATALGYTIAKSVPSDANFSNTTYSAGTGLSLSGTTFNHTNSITAGTVGTSTASSGSTLTVPYVTYNASGHVTATGTRTHTVSGFLTSLTAGTGISVSGSTINHANSITAGTAGTSTASSGNTITIPYVTYNATGHITAAGTKTHTVTVGQITVGMLSGS